MDLQSSDTILTKYFMRTMFCGRIYYLSSPHAHLFRTFRYLCNQFQRTNKIGSWKDIFNERCYWNYLLRL